MKRSNYLIFALFIIVASACTQADKVGEKKVKHFEPTWESLQQYECPTWFQDAKFGIYTHWGVYSVPKAEGHSDWYGRNMYNSWHKNYKFHKKNYGSAEEFGYEDFVPMFKAEKFNADEWADLFVEAGAQFAGPAGEHADGFSMWDSKVNPWNSVDMGPKRDVVAEMAKAIRKRGMKYVVSMHHSWLWGWFPTWMEGTDCYNAEEGSLYGEKLPESAWRVKGVKGYYTVDPRPSDNFERVWLQKVKEVVDGYSPDLLWFDNRIQILSEGVRQEMMAYAYNHAAKNDQEFVLTYKRPDFPLGTGTVDLERSRMPDIYPEPWLTDNSISRDSWSFTSDLECYTTDRLIHDLVDIVSKNGCLLLNVAPHPDGFIPEEQQQRLREMGKWLKLNGEAIYESRPWTIYGEGPTETKTGHLADQKFDGFSDQDIRFTTRDGQLYAIALGWPESGILPIKALGAASFSDEIKKIELIGHKGEIKFERKQLSLEIHLPDTKPCENAYVFRIN
ncbi:alpha-L-fucosidase [Saccharicrinis aurantiacus]|uniref:alpha-L-fucosidase n=1 Tax=Saccharicrinis aurantiacus TaxID=1849719 RepID=UPI0008383F04|nr:alpha-L-fucosidase [Saccharicrinis aurantiacus]